MSDLYNMINTVKSTCSDSTLLGTFVENHDNPRFASYVPLSGLKLLPPTHSVQIHK